MYNHSRLTSVEVASSGLLRKHSSQLRNRKRFLGPVAQLGERIVRNDEAAGSNPARSTRIRSQKVASSYGKPYFSQLRNRKRFLGPIAQLGARLNGIEKVVGSNPTGSINK